MSYVYIKSEKAGQQGPDSWGDLWTVGHYDPAGKWHPESDHKDEEAAAKRTAWLNGSGKPPAEGGTSSDRFMAMAYDPGGLPRAYGVADSAEDALDECKRQLRRYIADPVREWTKESDYTLKTERVDGTLELRGGVAVRGPR